MRNLEKPNKNLFLGYEGSLTMGILPVSIFCSGHTMYVQRLGERLGLQPYAVHGTFQFRCARLTGRRTGLAAPAALHLQLRGEHLTKSAKGFTAHGSRRPEPAGVAGL